MDIPDLFTTMMGTYNGTRTASFTQHLSDTEFKELSALATDRGLRVFRKNLDVFFLSISVMPDAAELSSRQLRLRYNTTTPIPYQLRNNITEALHVNLNGPDSRIEFYDRELEDPVMKRAVRRMLLAHGYAVEDREDSLVISWEHV